MKKRKSQKQEIIYHIVNSLLAGALVLLGSFTTGTGITAKGVLFASIAAGIVCISRFKEYWDGEADEYTSKLFKFL